MLIMRLHSVKTTQSTEQIALLVATIPKLWEETPLRMVATQKRWWNTPMLSVHKLELQHMILWQSATVHMLAVHLALQLAVPTI